MNRFKIFDSFCDLVLLFTNFEKICFHLACYLGYGRNQRNLCGSFYPKPMVTPVHRFQSIEGGLRNGRSGYHARLPLHCSTSVHYK